MRNNSLPNQSAITWNILPSEIVNAFKARLDNHVKINLWREPIYVF